MTNNSLRKAVFLDRDGTLIRDKNYLSRVEDIEYFSDTFEALKLMVTKGYRLYVITNQSGVGRGYFSIEAVNAIHQVMDEDMRAHKLPHFAGWGVCPHAPDQNCTCRKPMPELIQKFLERDQLDASLCYMVGDKEIDAACGIAAGMQGAVVRVKAAANQHTFHSSLFAFAVTLP